MAQSMQGNIWCKSNVNLGTSFYFAVPIDLIPDRNNLNKNEMLNSQLSVISSIVESDSSSSDDRLILRGLNRCIIIDHIVDSPNPIERLDKR